MQILFSFPWIKFPLMLYSVHLPENIHLNNLKSKSIFFWIHILRNITYGNQRPLNFQIWDDRNSFVLFCFYLLISIYFCWWVFVQIKNFSLNRIFHYRWKATNFNLCSALRTIEQRVFFNVSHLLWYGATLYNGYLQNRDTHTCLAEMVIYF